MNESRIEALEKRVTDLESKLENFDKESATRIFKIMKEENEEFWKKNQFPAFNQ